MADSIEQAVGEYLTTDSTFMALNSGVYWLEVDKGVTPTEPYITYFLVSDTGAETLINTKNQGESRIQFDVWDDNKVRGVRLRTTLRDKLNLLGEDSGGYKMVIMGINEQTIPRPSGTGPFHFVVDGIIKWNKG